MISSNYSWCLFLGLWDRLSVLQKKTTGRPDSQQPAGSQILKICMGIYRKIDKTNLLVRFDRFIDLTINSHTNLYNLAFSGLLWVWVPCGKKTNKVRLCKCYCNFLRKSILKRHNWDDKVNEPNLSIKQLNATNYSRGSVHCEFVIFPPSSYVNCSLLRGGCRLVSQ